MQSFTRRDFLKVSGITAAGLISGCTTPQKQKPNIIFILIDDLGWKDLGCYGSLFYETPNIDKLAAEGMLFTDAYAACPVCSPTRASILTGKYPARLHLTDWLPGRRNLPCQKLMHPEIVQQLPFKEKTIAEVLKEAGYKTASIGKWHLGHEDSYPTEHGFDINIGGYHRGMPDTYFSPYNNPSIADGPEGEYLTDRLTDEALSFIETNQNNPFFLYLSHYAVHDAVKVKLEAKKETIKKYQNKLTKMPELTGPDYVLEGNPDDQTGQIAYDERMLLLEDPQYEGNGYLPNRFTKIKQKQDNPIYAAMVEHMDESVGRVMQKLSDLNLDTNTIIIFMSDNGGLSSPDVIATAQLPLRGAKGWLYEGGIREPMIIKWPGKTKPGSTCATPVTSTDFYPTILEMAGLSQIPEQHQDGESLVPLLNKKKLNRDAIYWHWPHYSNHGQQSPAGVIRSGNYKLIEYYENGTVQLFNLKEDIGEQNNLAESMPEKAKGLQEKLHKWLKEVNAQTNTSNPEYEPDKENRFVRW